MTNALLPLIEEFLKETGMSPSRFGFLAARNGRLMERLRDGRRVWPEKEAEIRAFILSRKKDKAA